MAVEGTGLLAWDLAAREQSWSVEDGRTGVRIASSPDGEFLAVSSLYDRTVRFLSTRNGMIIVQHTIELGSGGGDYCYAGAYSADGSLLVPASYPALGAIRTDWDEGLEVVAGHNVKALAIRPGDNRIFSSSGDARISAHKREDFALLPGSAVNATNNIRSMAFNPSGQLLACGLEGGRVEIRRSTGDQVSGPVATFWTGSDCFFAAFMADGVSLVTGNMLGVGIWYLGDTVAPLDSRR